MHTKKYTNYKRKDIMALDCCEHKKYCSLKELKDICDIDDCQAYRFYSKYGKDYALNIGCANDSGLAMRINVSQNTTK